MHIHLSETKREVDDSIAKFGLSPVQRLEKLGFWGPQVSCAHCVHLNEKDREILKRAGTSIVHNPDSNMKLGSGFAPITDFAKCGISVGLGTDGAASNNDLSIWGAMELATKMQKSVVSDLAAYQAEQALRSATIEGAKALQMEKEIGSLEVGKRADVILVDLSYPHMQPIYNFSSQLVYSTTGLEVDTVLVEGKVLLKDRRFVDQPVAKIYADVEKWKKKIAKFLLEIKAKEQKA